MPNKDNTYSVKSKKEREKDIDFSSYSRRVWKKNFFYMKENRQNEGKQYQVTMSDIRSKVFCETSRVCGIEKIRDELHVPTTCVQYIESICISKSNNVLGKVLTNFLLSYFRLDSVKFTPGGLPGLAESNYSNSSRNHNYLCNSGESGVKSLRVEDLNVLNYSN